MTEREEGERRRFAGRYVERLRELNEIAVTIVVDFS